MSTQGYSFPASTIKNLISDLEEGLVVLGDENTKVSSINTIDNLQDGTLAFCSGGQYLEHLSSAKGGVCIINENHSHLASKILTLVISPDPRHTYNLILSKLSSQQEHLPVGISHLASIATSASIGKDCHIGPYVTIEDNVKISDNCVITAHSHIGKNVTVGRNTQILSKASITHCDIGSGCVIYSGVCIGSRGFGFTVSKEGEILPVPHLGMVKVGNNVEIGANSCIDRGVLGNTTIGDNTKIDNLVQIGHNVVIGKNCMISGHSAIAGSVTIGNNVQIGGHSGISGHIKIGDNVKIAGMSGVMHNIENNETIGGIPAVQITKWHRQTISLQKLAAKKSL